MSRHDRPHNSALTYLRKRPILGYFFLLAATSAIYYATIPILGAHYLQVCHYEAVKNAQICENWDAITAIIIRSASFLDEHNGSVTAIASAIIALFTLRLWQSTENTVKLTERTVELARKQNELERFQHVIINKPRLGIRSIVIIATTESEPLIKSGHLIRGHLVVTNSGATDAKILASGYRFYWSTVGLPMQPPLDGPETQPLILTEDPLSAYESRMIPVESHEPIGDEANTLGNGTLGENILFLMGYIRYADINGIERFMGFCRQYKPPRRPQYTIKRQDGKFIKVKSRDYEYED